jgi:arginine/lysine/ornithine decarboxylase
VKEQICHDRGKPLIVDEAWDAHLPFHEGLPTWAMDAGADVCVASVHKMGAGFERGSVYLQGDLVDPEHLSACADLLMTTSPNAILYSAIDGWRRQMVQHGTGLLGNALALARRLRTDIDALPGIRVLEDELLSAESSHDLDRMQVLMDLSGLASAATRPPTGCANTTGLTRGSVTTGGSWRHCPWPMTTPPPGVCWTR